MAAQHMTYYKHGSITYDLLKEWQHNISCPTLYMAAQNMTYLVAHMSIAKKEGNGSETTSILN